MNPALNKLFNHCAEGVALRLGWARQAFERQRGCYRILTYHGLIPDRLADRPWVSSQHVTLTGFRRQMAMLADLGPGVVRPLGELVARSQARSWDEPAAIALTFDDGLADNVHLALPILQEFGFHATFFVTTGYLDEPRLLINDKIRLLQSINHSHRPHLPTSLQCRDSHKQQPLTALAMQVEQRWAAVGDQVDPDGLEALAMMSWADAQALHAAGMTIGAHTVNHVILARETDHVRRHEIRASVARVGEQLDGDAVPFAYPNGLIGDWGPLDEACLAECGVPFAVTQQPGSNGPDTPRRALRRISIGRHCRDRAFLGHVLGWRDRHPLESGRATA